MANEVSERNTANDMQSAVRRRRPDADVARGCYDQILAGIIGCEPSSTTYFITDRKAIAGQRSQMT